MPRARLRGRPRSASLFLHDARCDPLGDRSEVEHVRQWSAQLRSETASRSRAGPARPLRAPHPKMAQPNFRGGLEIPRTDAARADFEKVSKRRSALSIIARHDKQATFRFCESLVGTGI